MRLIIVEDQIQVLKKIREMLSSLSDTVEIKMIWCNTGDESMVIPKDETGWYSVCTEEELYDVCDNELEIRANDHYLLDITLFHESQMDKMFSDYISVKLANHIMDNGIEDIKIKFYTYPLGISPRDFAIETKKWGKPIYRPKLDSDEYGEKEAKKIFVAEIKEYCNV